jgi:hypothetical protein
MDWESVMDWLYLAALFASLALAGMWVREREQMPATPSPLEG